MRKVFLALFAGMVIGVLASAPGHSAAAVMGSPPTRPQSIP